MGNHFVIFIYVKGQCVWYGSCAITHSFTGNDVIIIYDDHVRWTVTEGQESMQQDGIAQKLFSISNNMFTK